MQDALSFHRAHLANPVNPVYSCPFRIRGFVEEDRQ